MKLQSLQWTRVAGATVASAILFGCGGGGGGYGGSSTTPAASTTVMGTVATGQPLANASITVLDAAGRSRSAMAAADGSYAVDASDLTAPLVLKASGSRSGLAVDMVSVLDAMVAASANVVNITPLTTAIAANLSTTGQPGDLNPVTDRDRIMTMLTAADNALQAQMATMMQAIGVSGSPIRTPFAANGSGFDKLYDSIVVGRTAGNRLIIGPAAFHDGQNVNNCPQGGSYAGCAPTYGDMGMATTTNPNLCGSDIATGVGIPCDPTRAVDQQPSMPLSPITGGGVPITGPGITVGPPDNATKTPLSSAQCDALKATLAGLLGANGGYSGNTASWGSLISLVTTAIAQAQAAAAVTGVSAAGVVAAGNALLAQLQGDKAYYGDQFWGNQCP
jgi:hypothetical protein